LESHGDPMATVALAKIDEKEATVFTMAGGDSQSGRLIILNGGSSAGKTTLGRALQCELAEPWLLVGIDLLIWTLPPEMINAPDGLSVHEGVISRGEQFMPLYFGFQTAVATLARCGINVLVDDITLDGLVDQERWNQVLQGLEVCWIGVHCAPEIAAAREAGRGGRLPGIARHQAQSVHEGLRYDVEVDTGALDLHDELNVIAEWLGRTWTIAVSPRSTHEPRVPPLSVCTPGKSIHPAPWER
jgi:chloramphenicol 3-O phosphotransferase